MTFLSLLVMKLSSGVIGGACNGFHDRSLGVGKLLGWGSWSGLGRGYATVRKVHAQDVSLALTLALTPTDNRPHIEGTLVKF